jgi:hypothetical protein
MFRCWCCDNYLVYTKQAKAAVGLRMRTRNSSIHRDENFIRLRCSRMFVYIPSTRLADSADVASPSLNHDGPAQWKASFKRKHATHALYRSLGRALSARVSENIVYQASSYQFSVLSSLSLHPSPSLPSDSSKWLLLVFLVSLVSVSICCSTSDSLAKYMISRSSLPFYRCKP